MSDRYAPDLDTLPNGVVVESYGRAHAARQADALALLDEISWAGSAIVTKVRCACPRRSLLASVYRTNPAVIRIDPETHRDPELVEIRRDADAVEIVYDSGKFADILHAPDDRDLEARCKDCGRHKLDRDDVIAAYESGERELKIAP